MGADLHINSISDRNIARWKGAFDAAVKARDEADKTDDKSLAERMQAEVHDLYGKMYAPDGYFRDAYNGTSILNLLGLSWWTDVGDILDEDGYLQPEKIKELLAIVARREVPQPENLKLEGCKVDDYANSREVWHKSFVEHRKQLIAFLGHALDLNEAIRCSI